MVVLCVFEGNLCFADVHFIDDATVIFLSGNIRIELQTANELEYALRFNSKLTALNLHGVRREGAIYLRTPRTLLGGARPLLPSRNGSP